MELELCTDGADGAALAARYGFKRIELCSALSEGGLTPSYGLMALCSRYAVEVHAMIRPVAGGFSYPDWALEVIKRDILSAREAGASGVVFGVLDEMGGVAEVNRELVQLARSVDLQATFHRAFDYVADPDSSLERLVAFGFDRVLSSGQGETAIEGIGLLERLQKSHGDRIQIMAGSGVKPANAMEFHGKGLRHLHFTARKKSGDHGRFAMGGRWTPDREKMEAMAQLFA